MSISNLPATRRRGLAEFTQGCIDLFGKLLRDCRLPIHWHEATLPPVEVGTHGPQDVLSLEQSSYGLLKRRELVLDDVPDDLRINAKVLVY